MRYNKNTYLQILKSFGILSSSFALCACGNFGNDFSTQHDDEKLSKTEIRDFVTSELENFESIDEDKKTEILNFFSSNVDFFQTKNDLRKLFSVVKNDLNVLDEFIRGEKLLANLDELVMQMNVEAVAHELDDVEKMATDDFEQATKQEIEALQLEQQKKVETLIQFFSDRKTAIDDELKTLTSSRDILMEQKNQLQAELDTIKEKIKNISEREKVLKAEKKSVEAKLKKVNPPAPRKRAQASEE